MRHPVAPEAYLLPGDRGRAVNRSVALQAVDPASMEVARVAGLTFDDSEPFEVMVGEGMAPQAANPVGVRTYRVTPGTEGDGWVALMHLSAVAPARAYTTRLWVAIQAHARAGDKRPRQVLVADPVTV